MGASVRVSPRSREATAKKWQALVGDLRQCVSCNLQIALELAVAHARDLRSADGRDVVRPLDDTGDILLIDFGVLAITRDLVAGEVAVRALGEEVFPVDDDGPIDGRCYWGAWLVNLAAITTQLEEHLGQPGREHLH
jgi:hypothetical protein